MALAYPVNTKEYDIKLEIACGLALDLAKTHMSIFL